MVIIRGSNYNGESTEYSKDSSTRLGCQKMTKLKIVTYNIRKMYPHYKVTEKEKVCYVKKP